MSHLLTHYDEELLGPPTRLARYCRVCGRQMPATIPDRWQTCSYECSRQWPEYRDDPSTPNISDDGEGTPGWGAQDGDDIGHGLVAVDDYDPETYMEHPGPIDGDSGNY